MFPLLWEKRGNLKPQWKHIKIYKILLYTKTLFIEIYLLILSFTVCSMVHETGVQRMYCMRKADTGRGGKNLKILHIFIHNQIYLHIMKLIFS